MDKMMFSVCCVISLAAGLHLLAIPNQPVTLPLIGELGFTAGWGQPLVGLALIVCGGKCLIVMGRGMY